MTELIILRGLPGCGKSTYARKWVAEDPAHRAEVNRDHLRQMLHDGVFLGSDTESQVISARDAIISRLLKRGVSVISSDTNLPRRTIRDLQRLATLSKADWTVTDMTDVPLETCLDRNEQRLDKTPLPDHVIQDYHARFIAPLKGRPLDVPDGEENYIGDAISPYIPDDTLPPAIIVDIDGTVALKGSRDPFDETRVHEDRPNEPVIGMIQRLWAAHLASNGPGLNIIFLSGRTEGCRQATEDWLDMNIGVMYRGLYMRPVGDGRKDWMVKQELFDEHVRGKYNVIGVFDDRDQCIRLWRDIGLQTYQVADGNF